MDCQGGPARRDGGATGQSHPDVPAQRACDRPLAHVSQHMNILNIGCTSKDCRIASLHTLQNTGHGVEPRCLAGYEPKMDVASAPQPGGKV